MNWNGLLFAGPRDPRKDLARITTAADWDFSGYVLDSVRVDEYDCNWKTFIETYLEVYHVDPFHPGSATSPTATTSPSTTARSTRSRSSPPRPASSSPGTPAYQQVARGLPQAARRPRRRSTARSGLTLLPGPDVRVVSERAGRLAPDPALADAARTNVVEFYYPEEIVAVRARVHRGAAGGLRRDRARGRRDLPAPGPRPARAVRAGPRRRRPVPVADGRRGGAFP